MKNLSKLLFLVLVIILILPTNLSASSGPYNYRETWNSWTDYQRYIYLWGFSDAREQIWVDISSIIKEFREDKTLSLYELKNLIELTNEISIVETNASITDYEEINIGFQPLDLKVIRDIMNDLYKDPANAYISFKNMAFIAKDKLSGKSIENRLEDERKSIKNAEEKRQEFLAK
jgi:hypothetical protein